MNLKPLFNNFITSGIQSPELESIRRVRALNAFLLVLTLVSLLLALSSFLVSADLLMYACLLAGLLGISDIILLRITKNLTVAANYAFFILWGIFLTLRWNTGGMTDGGLILLSWVWNAVLILMAIYITGYLWGTVWATVIFIETGAALYLFSIGYQFPNLIPPGFLPIYSLGNYLSGLLVILLIAFMYENEKNDSIESENAKSKALIESRRYIDRIIERFPLPTFVLDKEHRVIQWNRAYQQMTGVPAEEIAGRKVHPSLCIDNQSSLADLLIEDPDSIAKRFSDAIVSETETGCFEMKMSLPAMKEGSQAIISVAPLRDESGAIKGAIETIQNVSHVPGEKHAPHNHISPTVELSSSPVFRVDSDGRISFWNKACEDAFGYSSSSMIGKSPLTFVAKSSRSAFRETIVRVLRGHSFKRESWKYYTAEGEPTYVMAQAYPLQIMGGEPKRECVIVSTDITDITSKMNSLERNVAEAKEQLKSVTEEYAFLKNLATFIRKKGGRGLDKGPGNLNKELRELEDELRGLDKK